MDAGEHFSISLDLVVAHAFVGETVHGYRCRQAHVKDGRCAILNENPLNIAAVTGWLAALGIDVDGIARLTPVLTDTGSYAVADNDAAGNIDRTQPVDGIFALDNRDGQLLYGLIQMGDDRLNPSEVLRGGA